MFIRRTKTRHTASGESYFSHRLVRSERQGTKVRQRTLLNLGHHFEIPQEQWSTLCTRLEQLLQGQTSLLPSELPDSVEREAQRLLAQLVSRESGLSGATTTEPATGERQSVDIDSLQLVRPRSVGVEQLGLWAMQQAGLTDLWQKLGLTGPQRAAITGQLIARMAAPGSECATHHWLGHTSALGDLLEVDFEAMSLMQLYRASDQLMKHRGIIEGHLFDRLTDLFGLDCTVTLYDLTNTYFEGAARTQTKAQRGRSKEKRSDCPLLTLGLVLDGSGWVRRSEVFAGNVAEGTTLQAMLQGLVAPPGALVVMDRGVATEANLTWLREQGYRYLVVSRQRQRHFDHEGAVTLTTASNERVALKKVLSDDGEEAHLYCYSDQRAKKEAGITQRFVDRFESALTRLSEGLSKPRTTRRIDKLWERIGRLKEKSRGVGQHYQIDIIADDGGINAKAIRWTRQAVEGSQLTHPGVYCLRSNELDWDAERMWRTYIMLTDLEAVFRSLKSELGLRPIFHHKQERSDGHLFITVLAYQLVQLIRRQLRAKGLHESWPKIRDIMKRQCRVTATFRRGDGRTLHVRKATRAEADQLAIYQALDIDPAPGGVRKMVA